MTQERLTALMLQVYPPDILIQIPRNTCDTFDFHKARTLIELGRNACRQALSLDSFAVE
jgi:NTE family protein